MVAPSFEPPVRVFPDTGALMRAAAEQVVELAALAIASRRRFTWVLSGGSTPRQLYALLATRSYASRIDWARVCFFWGDERHVPPDHPDSNYDMAREALLTPIGALASNVHRMRGELPPVAAAALYEAELRSFFAQSEAARAPAFDLVLLGMGDDGHTASLFPGTPALLENERWVIASDGGEARGERVSLTPVIMNAARQISFLVAGASKAARLSQVLRSNAEAKGSLGEAPPELLPVQYIRPVNGDLIWLLDAAAAGL